MKRRTALKLVGGSLVSWSMAPLNLLSSGNDEGLWALVDFAPVLGYPQPEFSDNEVLVCAAGFGNDGFMAVQKILKQFEAAHSFRGGFSWPPGLVMREQACRGPGKRSFHSAMLNADLVLLLGSEEAHRNPDFVECARMARDSGALTVAILQSTSTPPPTFPTSLQVGQIDFWATLPSPPEFMPPGAALSEAAYFIPEMVLRPGVIGIDLVDVQAILQQAGKGFLTIGYGKGIDRGKMAVTEALGAWRDAGFECNLIRRALATLHGPEDLSMDDFDQVSSTLYESLDEDADLITSVHNDPFLHDKIRVTIAGPLV